MILVERGRELGALERLLSCSVEGSGAVAWIRGPVACGKTALLNAVRERAHTTGALFLGAVGVHAEQGLPLGVVGQLLQHGELSADIRAKAVDLLNDPATIRMAQGDEPDPRDCSRVFGALLGLVRLVSTERPVVLGIDDVQHADHASLRFLSYLVRRSTADRLLVVITESTQAAPDPALFADIVRQPQCHQIRPEMLSPAGVETLIGQYIGMLATPNLAAECYSLTNGNPLLVSALIKDYLGRAGSAPGPLSPGSAYQAAVLTCLHGSGRMVTDMARALAILGEPVSLAAAAEMVGAPSSATSRVGEILEAMGILAGGTFRSQAAVTAIIDGLSWEEQAAWRARAAAVLHRRGATGSSVARQLVDADRVEASWGVPALHDAAEEALTDGRDRQAVDFLQRALSACPDDRQKLRLTAALVRAQWHIDPGAVVHHLPTLVGAARRRALPGRDVVILVHQLLWHGRTREAVEMIAVLEADARRPGAGGDVRPADLAALRQWIGWTYPDLAGLVPPGGREDAPAGVQTLATVLSDADQDEAVLAVRSMLRRRRSEQAVLAPMVAAVLAFCGGDRVRRAAAWCRQLIQDAASAGAAPWRAVVAITEAMRNLAEGELDEARGNARRALYLFTPSGWGVAIGPAVAVAVLVATAAGQVAEAAEYLAVPVPMAMFDTPCGLFYLFARGRHHLAAGRQDAAMADFRSCGSLMRKWRIDLPSLIPWRSELSLVLSRLGRHEEATRLAEEQLALLTLEQHWARGLSMRALAMTKPPSERHALLRSAVSELRRSGDVSELRNAMADLSRLITASPDAPSHGGPAKMAGGAGRTATPRPEHDPYAGLSGAERRVALLAARGFTNRQIARRLQVTASTVEQHLTRVYRKLNVSRRTDLPDGQESPTTVEIL